MCMCMRVCACVSLYALVVRACVCDCVQTIFGSIFSICIRHLKISATKCEMFKVHAVCVSGSESGGAQRGVEPSLASPADVML